VHLKGAKIVRFKCTISKQWQTPGGRRSQVPEGHLKECQSLEILPKITNTTIILTRHAWSSPIQDGESFLTVFIDSSVTFSTSNCPTLNEWCLKVPAFLLQHNNNHGYNRQSGQVESRLQIESSVTFNTSIECPTHKNPVMNMQKMLREYAKDASKFQHFYQNITKRIQHVSRSLTNCRGNVNFVT